MESAWTEVFRGSQLRLPPAAGVSFWQWPLLEMSLFVEFRVLLIWLCLPVPVFPAGPAGPCQLCQGNAPLLVLWSALPLLGAVRRSLLCVLSSVFQGLGLFDFGWKLSWDLSQKLIFLGQLDSWILCPPAEEHLCGSSCLCLSYISPLCVWIGFCFLGHAPPTSWCPEYCAFTTG